MSGGGRRGKIATQNCPEAVEVVEGVVGGGVGGGIGGGIGGEAGCCTPPRNRKMNGVGKEVGVDVTRWCLICRP